MRKSEFNKWLQEKYQNPQEKKENRTPSNRISNCKKVEKHYGDLDKHVLKDNCERIIRELTYNTDDKRNGVKPKHQINFDGDIRTGSATLKQAVKLYVKFFKENPIDINETTNILAEIINNYNYDKALETDMLQKSIIKHLQKNLKSFE